MGLIDKLSRKVKTISANIKESIERNEEKKRAKLDKELEDLPKQIELERKRLELEQLKKKRASLNGQNGTGGLGGFCNPDSLKIQGEMFKGSSEQLEKDSKITYVPPSEPIIKHPELRRDNTPTFKQPELKGKNKPFKQLQKVKQ